MRRGEVWWADLGRPAGRRPVLLLSRDVAYRVRANVTVAPVTRTIRDIPTEVVLGRQDGMSEQSVVNLDDIITIPKRLLERPITALSQEKMVQVEQAIAFALALPT